MKLHVDSEWLKRKLLEDGDAECGAGMLAYALDPERIATAVNNGEDPNAIFEHPYFKNMAEEGSNGKS